VETVKAAAAAVVAVVVVAAVAQQHQEAERLCRVKSELCFKSISVQNQPQKLLHLKSSTSTMELKQSLNRSLEQNG